MNLVAPSPSRTIASASPCDTSSSASRSAANPGCPELSMIDNSGHPGFAALREALLEVSQGLALAIVRDGEGATKFIAVRSEERRVGKECRSRWSPYH